jgi:hypothetical protein
MQMRLTSSINTLSGESPFPSTLPPVNPVLGDGSFPNSLSSPVVKLEDSGAWNRIEVGANGRAEGATGWISFEMTILPVSMLQRTSHQPGRSAKAGLQTPAMNPGLQCQTSQFGTTTSAKWYSHSLQVVEVRQVGVGECSLREPPQHRPAPTPKGARREYEVGDVPSRLSVSEKDDSFVSDEGVVQEDDGMRRMAARV